MGWPGRDKVDARAEFFFIENPSKHLKHYYFAENLSEPVALSENRLLKRRSTSDSAKSQTEESAVLDFYWKVNRESYRIPLNETFFRESWYVGVAANPWRAVGQLVPLTQHRLAHWGIYIVPRHEAPVSEVPVYRIFGMNFVSEYKSDLLLEDVWGTRGEHGKGEWKKMVCRDEFQVVGEPGLEQTLLHFSLEEFVLTLQWILRNFVRRLKKVEDGKIETTHRGDAYSLLNANCQHYARRVIQTLKERDWANSDRKSQRFSLLTFEKEARERLSEETKEDKEELQAKTDLWESVSLGSQSAGHHS